MELTFRLDWMMIDIIETKEVEMIARLLPTQT